MAENDQVNNAFDRHSREKAVNQSKHVNCDPIDKHVQDLRFDRRSRRKSIERWSAVRTQMLEDGEEKEVPRDETPLQMKSDSNNQDVV